MTDVERERKNFELKNIEKPFKQNGIFTNWQLKFHKSSGPKKISIHFNNQNIMGYGLWSTYSKLRNYQRYKGNYMKRENLGLNINSEENYKINLYNKTLYVKSYEM